MKKLSKIFSILGLPGRFVRLFFMPKGAVLIFNHTTRVRRSSHGPTPIYLGRIFGEIHPLVVFDGTKASYHYPAGTAQFVYSGFHPAGVLISRFVPRVTRQRVVFLVQVGLCKWAFRILRPRKVVLLVWYGKEWAVAAARELGIETIDIQHGVIHEQHPGYAVQLMEPLWASNMPDFCWVYGSHWKGLLLKSGWSEERVRVCGYYIDHVPKYPDVPFKPYLLYISAPGFQEHIKQHIRSILPVLKARGLKAVIAPHQHVDEDTHPYKDILAEEVLMISDFDAYDLVARCEVCIGVTSTLLYEARIFGKSSYTLVDKSTYGKVFPNWYPSSLGHLVDTGMFRQVKLGEVPEPFELPASVQLDAFFAPSQLKELLGVMPAASARRER